MHKLKDRTYVGVPNEPAFVSQDVTGGGQTSITLNGAPFPGNQFSLGSVGQQNQLQINLVGPVGAACVVGISNVDGGTDGDLLLCQPHNPAPSQFYDFSAAPGPAVRRLTGMRAPATGAKAAIQPPAKSKKTRKTPRKRSKRGGGR
jgi:hypothetical protein